MVCFTVCNRFSAEYNSFYIESEAKGYTLRLSGFTGDTWDAMNCGEERVSNGMPFSTKDNGTNRGYCALYAGGGWWYSSCYCACFTCGSNISKMHWALQTEMDPQMFQQSYQDGELASARMMIKPHV